MKHTPILQECTYTRDSDNSAWLISSQNMYYDSLPEGPVHWVTSASATKTKSIKYKQSNGYSKMEIKWAFTKLLYKNSEESPADSWDDVLRTQPQVESLPAYLPYVRGTTDKIGWILTKHHTACVQTNIRKVDQF